LSVDIDVGELKTGLALIDLLQAQVVRFLQQQDQDLDKRPSVGDMHGVDP
jgi:hypothetical protein